MITVRRAEVKDVDAIHSLGRSISGFSVNKETVTFWPKDILTQVVNSNDTCILVAEIEQQIVGFIIANLNFSLRKAIIENVYVKPDNRGTGIGRKLVDELINSLSGTAIEYICTLIPLDADDASRLYTEAGFSKGESFLWLDKSMTDTFKQQD